MSSRNRFLLFTLVGLAACVTVVVGLQRCLVTAVKGMPSYQRAHASVEQILFVQGRTLVRNEQSGLFASDDNGRSWSALSGRPESLSIANGNELWGAHGWAGRHEGPSASLWHSTDRGDTWSKTDIELPARGEALDARLPAAFINEPGDAPLLVMADAQLVRPALVSDSSTWKRVGQPISSHARSSGTINVTVAGVQYGQSIYVASSGFMFFSDDGGMTWATQSVHPFHDAKIRCRETTCYALLNQIGSEWSGLMTTDLGTNKWNLVRTFAASEVTRVLTSDQRHAAIKQFGATALLPAETGIYVAGIVDANRSAWGAVLLVDRNGMLASVGHGVPNGLWVLEQGPDRTLWAGGQGAYQLQGDEWAHVWPAPEPER